MEEKGLTTAKEVFKAKEVILQEEWDSLIEDCKAILIESVTTVRGAIIECKWELGNRLLEAGDERITPLLQRVAVEVHVSERDLFYCLAFRKKFPSLKEMWGRVPEGKNISWHKLVNNYIDFALPKPVLSIEDKFDEWGITDWWQKQKDLQVLRIKNKGNAFTLVVRVGKVLEVDRKRLSEKISIVYTEITNFYIGIKGWKKADLDHNDYGRINNAIKAMLEKASFDKEKVKQAIKWCYLKYKDSPHIDWNINTCEKKYAEAVKNHGR